jgi:hypothetical protein
MARKVHLTNNSHRWDDDVVFKNQARGTDDKGKKKEFVNVSHSELELEPRMPY